MNIAPKANAGRRWEIGGIRLLPPFLTICLVPITLVLRSQRTRRRLASCHSHGECIIEDLSIIKTVPKVGATKTLCHTAYIDSSY